MGERNFLLERKNGIGGSDIGAIMGVDKTKSAYDVYLHKTIPIKELLKHRNNIEIGESEDIYWKFTLKEVVANEFSFRSGKKVRKENKQLVDEEYDFIIGNIDRKIVGENSILMCKVVNAFLDENWSGEGIPASFVLQAQHYMRVSKSEKCYIATLIGGQKFIQNEILRDEHVINMITKVEKDFWINNVLKKVPPQF